MGNLLLGLTVILYGLITSKVSHKNFIRQNEVLLGLGHITYSEFLSKNQARTYSSDGEINLVTKTDFLNSIEKLASIKFFLDIDRPTHSTSTIDLTNTGSTNKKKILVFISLNKVHLFLVSPITELFSIEHLKTKDLVGTADTDLRKVEFVEENDPNELIVFTGHKIWYFKNNFGLENYLATPYNLLIGFGAVGNSLELITGFTSARDGTKTFFISRSFKIQTMREGATLGSEFILNDSKKDTFSYTFGMAYNKSSKLLFIHTWNDFFICSWKNSEFQLISSILDRSSTSNYHLKVYDDIENPDRVVIIFMVYNTLQPYYYYKITNTLLRETLPIYNINSKATQCRINPHIPSTFEFEIHCANSLQIAKVLEQKRITSLHFPLSKNTISFSDKGIARYSIEYFRMLEFNPTYGLFQPTLNFNSMFNKVDSNPKEKNWGLYIHQHSVYVIDEDYHDQNLITDFLKKTNIIFENGWLYANAIFSRQNPTTHVLVLGIKTYGSDYHFGICKKKFDESEAGLFFLKNPRKFEKNWRNPIKRFNYMNINYAISFMFAGVNLYREDPSDADSIFLHGTDFTLKDELDNQITIRALEVIHEIEGLIVTELIKSKELRFFLYNGVDFVYRADLKIEDATLNVITRFYGIENEVWLFGRRAIRLMLTSDLSINNLEIEVMNENLNELYSDITMVPIQETSPDFSFYIVRLDRSTAIAHTSPKYISVGCEANCIVCLDLDKSCVICRPYYQMEPNKDGNVFCKRICNKEGEYHKESDNTCGKCDPTCLTCSGPTNTECLSCPSGGFYKELEKKCEVGGCSFGLKTVNGENIKVGYYKGTLNGENFQRCRQCSVYCKTCNGPFSENCLGCFPENYFHIENLKLGCSKSSCEPGYGTYLADVSSEAGVTKHNICKTCHPNCQSCIGKTEFDCIICKGGSKPKEKKCFVCPEGQVYNKIKQNCTDCSYITPGCTQCDPDKYECFECEEGSELLEKKCVECNFPKVFDLDTKKCKKCKEKHPECDQCSPSTLICQRCQKFYQEKNGACERVKFPFESGLRYATVTSAYAFKVLVIVGVVSSPTMKESTIKLFQVLYLINLFNRKFTKEVYLILSTFKEFGINLFEINLLSKDVEEDAETKLDKEMSKYFFNNSENDIWTVLIYLLYGIFFLAINLYYYKNIEKEKMGWFGKYTRGFNKKWFYFFLLEIMPEILASALNDLGFGRQNTFTSIFSFLIIVFYFGIIMLGHHLIWKGKGKWISSGIIREQIAKNDEPKKSGMLKYYFLWVHAAEFLKVFAVILFKHHFWAQALIYFFLQALIPLYIIIDTKYLFLKCKIENWTLLISEAAMLVISGAVIFEFLIFDWLFAIGFLFYVVVVIFVSLLRFGIMILKIKRFFEIKFKEKIEKKQKIKKEKMKKVRPAKNKVKVNLIKISNSNERESRFGLNSDNADKEELGKNNRGVEKSAQKKNSKKEKNELEVKFFSY